MVLDELADHALFVVAVAEDARANRTNLHASGLHAFRNAVVAPGALIYNLFFRQEKPGTVGTCLNTVTAADAVFLVY